MALGTAAAFRRNSDPPGQDERMFSLKRLLAVTATGGLLLTAGCGSSSSSSSVPSGSSGGSTPAGGSGQSPGALSADARSASTGDIPDNQVFLVFHNSGASYSMKYPEGWTQLGTGNSVTFQDKNNLVHVAISRAAPPTAGSVTAQLQTLKRSRPTLTFRPPQMVSLGSARAFKVVYTTQSEPNAVTGRRVLLIVNRYELAHAGNVATVDLGTPKGVDNVDAYRMMIDSFRWR
jgi:hypothetical protein